MKPLIGITMGDPAGVGPELIVKLLKNKSFDFSKFIIFGSSKVLDYEFRKYNVKIPIKNLSTISSVDTSKEFILNFEPKKLNNSALIYKSSENFFHGFKEIKGKDKVRYTLNTQFTCL